MQDNAPTPFADVNDVLRALLAGVQQVLGDRLVGLYVHGSLAAGDFEPGRSDVDFLVVTAGELPASMLPTLTAMHARIRAGGLAWATKLEGSYIPRDALRRHDPARARHPALRVDGSFDVDGHGSEWIIQRHVLREHGIVLAGPSSQTLIDPVHPTELRQAVTGLLHEWWAPQLDDHSWLSTDEYRAYAVLTMCRAAYTLAHGTVVSKAAAARWALSPKGLGECWAPLVERSLAWRRDAKLEIDLDETLSLIRNTLDTAARER